MSDKKYDLLKDVQIAQFALIETNLYLDTHPEDTEALKALEYYAEKLARAIERYEDECTSLTAEARTNLPFEWVKAPFPWEIEC